MDDWKRTGDILRGLREERGLSFRELGQVAGYNYAGLHRIERGDRPLSHHAFAAYAEGLEVEPLDLAILLGYPIAREVRPAPAVESPVRLTKAAEIREALVRSPYATAGEIAREVGADPQYVANVRWRESAKVGR